MDKLTKPIEGYERKYFISENGDVTNQKGKLIKPYCRSRYITVTISKNGKMKTHYVHRLVAIAFLPNPKNYPEINHKDGNKHNNNVSNLEWCTSSINKQHAYDTGLKVAPSGERQGLHKLTWKDVEKIRNYYVRGSKENGSAALAKRFNVAPETILQVVNYKTWNKGS